MTTKLQTSERFRQLDHAYLHLLASQLPVFRSARRQHISGHLVVLDTLTQEKGKLRSVPNPRDNDEETSKRVDRAIKAAVQRVKKANGGKLKVNAALIKKGLNFLRQEIGNENRFDLRCLAQEKEHELENSFFNTVIVKEMREKGTTRGWFEAGPYIEKVKFEPTQMEEAYEAILSEAALCTHEIESIEDFDPGTIIPIFVPISALGVFRGVAVYFLLDTQEWEELRPAMAKVLRLGLINTLNAIYSNAVIDVFTAYWMSRLGELTFSGGARFRRIVKDSFRYLYPCREFRADEGFDNSQDSYCLSVEFNDATVKKFLRFSQCHWRLIYEKSLGYYFFWRSSKPSDTAQGAYVRLIEAKLRDVALTATEFLNQEHWRILEVFGHHTGNLFKTSGAIELLNPNGHSREVTVGQLRRALGSLMPIWGMASAISFIQKKDSRSNTADKGDVQLYDKMLRTWLDGGSLLMSDVEIVRQIYMAIINLTRHVYDSGTEAPLLRWIVERPKGIEADVLTGEWDINDERQGELVSLPLLRDAPGLFDKTFAFSMGLLEMLRNIRCYPDRNVAAGRDEAESLERLPEPERAVRLRCSLDSERNGIFKLECRQPIFLWAGELPVSESLKKIQDIESKGFEGWVKTSALEKCGETSRDGVVVASQVWQFDWQKVRYETRRIYAAQS